MRRSVMGQIDGKVAIVTGGASGIGAACVATLAREGAKVVVTDVDDAGGQAVCGAVMRGADALPRSETPSRTKGPRRNLGDLTVGRAACGGGVDKIGSAGGEAIFLHQDVALEESW